MLYSTRNDVGKVRLNQVGEIPGIHFKLGSQPAGAKENVLVL